VVNHTTSEVLQVRDVRAPLAGGRQGRHAERVHRAVRVQIQLQHIPFDERLHRPPRERCPAESLTKLAADPRKFAEWMHKLQETGRIG
jgi:hypothetical protein